MPEITLRSSTRRAPPFRRYPSDIHRADALSCGRAAGVRGDGAEGAVITLIRGSFSFRPHRAAMWLLTEPDVTSASTKSVSPLWTVLLEEPLVSSMGYRHVPARNQPARH